MVGEINTPKYITHQDMEVHLLQIILLVIMEEAANSRRALRLIIVPLVGHTVHLQHQIIHQPVTVVAWYQVENQVVLLEEITINDYEGFIT